MRDWLDCFYLCFIIHFPQRKPARARNTSAGTIVKTNRRGFWVPSACRHIQKKSDKVSFQRKAITGASVEYRPAQPAETLQTIIDHNLAEVKCASFPPASCRWGPSLWLNSACRSWTFNKISMLKRQHSRRPSKLQCVEPPRVIRMQVASGANAPSAF